MRRCPPTDRTPHSDLKIAVWRPDDAAIPVIDRATKTCRRLRKGHQLLSTISGLGSIARNDQPPEAVRSAATMCSSRSVWPLAGQKELHLAANKPPEQAGSMDDAAATVRQFEILHGGEEHLGLHLDSLCKQLPGARSKDIRQGIIDLVGLTKPNKTAILVHGVSLSLRGSGRLDTRLDTPPISYRHHPVSRLAPRRNG